MNVRGAVEVQGASRASGALWPRGASARSALVVLILGVALCRLGVLTSDWGYDTGAWMYVSQRLLAGARLYAEVSDNKLPPLYWIGALYWETGFPRAAMFATEVALTVLSALALGSVLRLAGLGARAALLFGILFVCAAQPAWEYAHRLETYALAPLALGVALIARGVHDPERAQSSAFLLGGLLVGIATSLRAQHALDALILGAWVLAVSGRARWSRFARYTAGGVAWAACVLTVAWLQGYLPDLMRDAVLGSAGYAAGGEHGRQPSFGNVIWALRTNVDKMPLAWASLASGALLAAAAWRRFDAAGRAVVALVVALAVAQFASTFVARHQILHYHFPLGWTAALLAGLGAAGAGLRLAQDSARVSWLAPVVGVVLLAAAALPDSKVYAGLYEATFGVGERRVDRLAQLVREHVPPDGPLYVLDDYALAGALTRLPNPLATPRAILAMQAVFLDPERPPEGASPYARTTLDWGREFRAEMEREPPPWLVRKAGIEDELTPWVRARYAEVVSTSEFTVWRLAPEEG